jgi:hypothetical protein
MATKSSTQNFVMAQNSAILLDAATASQLSVRGIQGMGLCLGFTMETQKVSEMGRRIALVVPSGGAYEETSVNYNFLPGDASLEVLRSAALNSTKLINVRMYVKAGCDFTAPDLISDAASGLYVGTMSDPKVDSPNGIYTGTMSYMPGGPFCLFIAHKVGAAVDYVAATRTVTNADNDFITRGFEVGDTLIIDNIPNQTGPKYFKAESVAAGAIVLVDGVGDEASIVADWSGGATTAIHGATPMPVSGYGAECD